MRFSLRNCVSVCWGGNTVCHSTCLLTVRASCAGSSCSTPPSAAPWRWGAATASCNPPSQLITRLIEFAWILQVFAHSVWLSILPFQQIMKDKWINIGYEKDELKPHVEPVEDYTDSSRIGKKYCYSPFGPFTWLDILKKFRIYSTFYFGFPVYKHTHNKMHLAHLCLWCQ